MSPYPEPVARLLTLGDPGALGDDWPDYLDHGLAPEHIPDLIRMATDPALNLGKPDSPDVWAPLHAWRALGELQAGEAVEPLLALLEDEELQDDWAAEELPLVFGKIGPPAIAQLAAHLANPRHSQRLRMSAAQGLSEIAQEYPGTRSECVAVLTQILDDPTNTDRELNGFVLGSLLDLDAVESAEVIQRAFERGAIDESFAGDWEEVACELGLTDRPARRRSHGFGMRPAITNPGGTSPKQKADARRKQAKQSRKRQRRKKK
jgi:hypothetical protein